MADHQIIMGMTLFFFSSITCAQLPYQKTHLYSKIAKNCQTVDWHKWKHPAKAVFKKYQIKLQKVQLCNDQKYPVFIGRSKYPLNAVPNYRYANEFFVSILLENNDWPYAFVETNSQEIVYVAKKSGAPYFEKEKY